MGFKRNMKKICFAIMFLILMLLPAETALANEEQKSNGLMETFKMVYDLGDGEATVHIGAATGDYSVFAPWVALAAISLGGIMIQLVLLRRSKDAKDKKKGKDDKDKKEKGRKSNGKKGKGK